MSVLNLISPEPLIQAALEAALADTDPQVGVYTLADLPAIQDNQHLAPAVFLIYAGLEIGQTRADQRWVTYQVAWHVIPVVANLYDPKSGRDSRLEAGQIMGRCCNALQGLKIAKGWTALQAVPPQPPFFDVGFTYYPLSFATAAELKGDQTA